MRKNGFTLAEVLISLAIIGIIAAVGFPAVNSLKPNNNKISYLKVHDSISYAIKDLASNSRLYPVWHQANNVSCAYNPLLNTEASQLEDYKNYQGDSKLCSLLGLNLGVKPEDLTCEANAYEFKLEDYANKFTSPSFETQNGYRWRIVPQVATVINAESSTFQTDIFVDVNPSNNNVKGKDESCIYNENTCKDPDIFKFLVSAKGNLVAADPMGKFYLETRQTVNQSKKKPESNEFTDFLKTSDRMFKPFVYAEEEDNEDNNNNLSGDSVFETPDNMKDKFVPIN